MKNLLLTDLLEKEFNDVKDYVTVNIIPKERKEHPEHAEGVSDEHITFAYMIACTKAFIEQNPRGF